MIQRNITYQEFCQKSLKDRTRIIITWDKDDIPQCDYSQIFSNLPIILVDKNGNNLCLVGEEKLNAETYPDFTWAEESFNQLNESIRFLSKSCECCWKLFNLQGGALGICQEGGASTLLKSLAHPGQGILECDKGYVSVASCHNFLPIIAIGPLDKTASITGTLYHELAHNMDHTLYSQFSEDPFFHLILEISHCQKEALEKPFLTDVGNERARWESNLKKYKRSYTPDDMNKEIFAQLYEQFCAVPEFCSTLIIGYFTLVQRMTSAACLNYREPMYETTMEYFTKIMYQNNQNEEIKSDLIMLQKMHQEMPDVKYERIPELLLYGNQKALEEKRKTTLSPEQQADFTKKSDELDKISRELEKKYCEVIINILDTSEEYFKIDDQILKKRVYGKYKAIINTACMEKAWHKQPVYQKQLANPTTPIKEKISDKSNSI